MNMNREKQFSSLNGTGDFARKEPEQHTGPPASPTTCSVRLWLIQGMLINMQARIFPYLLCV